MSVDTTESCQRTASERWQHYRSRRQAPPPRDVPDNVPESRRPSAAGATGQLDLAEVDVPDDGQLSIGPFGLESLEVFAFPRAELLIKDRGHSAQDPRRVVGVEVESAHRQPGGIGDDDG